MKIGQRKMARVAVFRHIRAMSPTTLFLSLSFLPISPFLPPLSIFFGPKILRLTSQKWILLQKINTNITEISSYMQRTKLSDKLSPSRTKEMHKVEMYFTNISEPMHMEKTDLQVCLWSTKCPSTTWTPCLC